MNTESPAQSVRDADPNPAPTERIITIGTQQFTVSRLPLGALRKVVPAFTRLARCFEGGEIDDEAFADVFTVLAIGTGKPVAELQEMPGTFAQIMAGVEAIADVCGLKRRAPEPEWGQGAAGESTAAIQPAAEASATEA